MNIIVKHFFISGILALLIIQAEPAFCAERSIAIQKKLDKTFSKTVGDYRALIIGINKYKDNEINPLQTAVFDARALAKILKKSYGFEDITLLIDDEADRSNIIKRFRYLATRSKEDDSILIYYAGHGELDKITESGYWIPYDATGSDPSTYIDNAIIQKYIGAIPARHVLLVADSCFSGSLFGQSRALPPIIDDKFYSSLFEERSRWGMTSGNLTPVSDGGSGGHSIFAYHFLKALKRNKQPYITPREIYQIIAPIVRNNSEQMPITKPIKNTGDEGGEFIFINMASLSQDDQSPPNKAIHEAATVDDRAETAAWKLIENSTYPEDIQDFLNEFPDGIYAPVAKMKLKQLKRHSKQGGIEERSRAEEARREEERLRLQIELEQKKIELEQKREAGASGSSGSSSSDGGFDPSSDNPWGEDF